MIEIVPSPHYIAVNKRNPLKPVQCFGVCRYFACGIDEIGLTKYVNEKYVIRILNHEIMHSILFRLEGSKISHKFDKIDNRLKKEWHE